MHTQAPVARQAKECNRFQPALTCWSAPNQPGFEPLVVSTYQIPLLTGSRSSFSHADRGRKLSDICFFCLLAPLPDPSAVTFSHADSARQCQNEELFCESLCAAGVT